MTQAPQRILLTGANGHLGQRLLRYVAERPQLVARAAVRSERAARTLETLPPAARPEPVLVDYADTSGLARACEGCHSVVHLVGIIKESSTSRYRDAHEKSCSAIGAAAAKAGVKRIVYLSILGSDAASSNACLASRGRAERILLESSVASTLLRVPMVLAPGEPAARVLARQARANTVPLVRGGATRQQPIDAEDVIEAIAAAAAQDSDEDLSLDLAGPESLPHRELVRRAAALLGRRPRIVPIPFAAVWLFATLAERLSADPPLTRAMLGVLDHDDCVDPEPARRALGIELTPLDESLARCVGPGAT